MQDLGKRAHPRAADPDKVDSFDLTEQFVNGDQSNHLIVLLNLRQHRTIRGVRLACILFRQIAQKSLERRPHSCGLFGRSDEKSDGAIRTPELCGVALI